MNDYLKAYSVSVQGAAKLKWTDETTISIGYDDSTDYPCVNFRELLVDNGMLRLEELNLPIWIDFVNNNFQ